MFSKKGFFQKSDDLGIFSNLGKLRLRSVLSQIGKVLNSNASKKFH